MSITRKHLEKWGINFGIFAAVVVSVYGVISFIDYRVDARLTDPATLIEISSRVRPSCVFDNKGSVLYDSGAMTTIEAIELKYPPKSPDEWYPLLPTTIVVRPNRLLQEAPLLRPVDSYTATIESARGPRFEWIYTLTFIAGPRGKGEESCRFLLEILP